MAVRRALFLPLCYCVFCTLQTLLRAFQDSVEFLPPPPCECNHSPNLTVTLLPSFVSDHPIKFSLNPQHTRQIGTGDSYPQFRCLPLLALCLTLDWSRTGALDPRRLKRTTSYREGWFIRLGSSRGSFVPFLSPSSSPQSLQGLPLPLDVPRTTGFPSTLAPAKPMEQAAAPKVPCTRAIVSRTRPHSARSSRLRRQRGSSDTTSQSRYLQWERGR